MIQLHIPSVFVFLLGVLTPDSSTDLTPRPLSSAAPTSAPPPPPPPKNAARMLALALAESAQQVSVQSPSQSSGPPTPVSSVQPQVSNFGELSHPLTLQLQIAAEEGERTGTSPPAYSSATTVITSSCDLTSASLQPSESTSSTTRPSESATTRTGSTPPNTPPYKCVELPSSTSVTSPARKSPERRQLISRQPPGHSSSSGATPNPQLQPRCGSKTDKLFQQSVPEVNVCSTCRSELHDGVRILCYSGYDVETANLSVWEMHN